MDVNFSHALVSLRERSSDAAVRADPLRRPSESDSTISIMQTSREDANGSIRCLRRFPFRHSPNPKQSSGRSSHGSSDFYCLTPRQPLLQCSTSDGPKKGPRDTWHLCALEAAILRPLVPDHCDGGSVTRGYAGRIPAPKKSKKLRNIN
jgi:hypothetical protein